MNLTDNLINSALLGTNGKEMNLKDFPEELHETAQQIVDRATDPEEAFYKCAALLFAYRRAGSEAASIPETAFTEAPPETSLYMSRTSASLLSRLLSGKYYVLLLYGYELAAKTGKIIPPEFLPDLLSHAFENNTVKTYREKELVLALSGNRGKWLLPFMGFSIGDDATEENWETASHAARQVILTRIRKENPARGMELLQNGLKGESANHRAELVECLRTGLSLADEPFLASLAQTDRSSHVKDTARLLLESIPGSELSKFYAGMLKGKLKYNRLLGWSAEKIEYTPELKNAGIEEVSPNKKEKDSDFILRQLAERVPLSFWCEFFEADEGKAARRLALHPPFPKFFSVSKPIRQFNDSRWAYHTLKEAAPTPVELIELIAPAEREEIKLEYLPDNNYIPEGWFGEITGTWGEKFSRFAIEAYLRNRYFYYTKEAAEKLAVYTPFSLKAWLCQKEKQYNESSHQREFLLKIREYMEMKEELARFFSPENTPCE